MTGPTWTEYSHHVIVELERLDKCQIEINKRIDRMLWAIAAGIGLYIVKAVIEKAGVI